MNPQLTLTWSQKLQVSPYSSQMVLQLTLTCPERGRISHLGPTAHLDLVPERGRISPHGSQMIPQLTLTWSQKGAGSVPMALR
jgi:hypothetical protein